MPLYLFYTMVQKSQTDQKLKSRGSRLKAAFVLLTFQFQVCSTLGKQLSLFRAKISGFDFSPTSKRLLQVCVVHVPIPPVAHKVTATALSQYREDNSKISEMCWCKRKFLNFFLLSKQMCFFGFASPLSIWRRTPGFRRTSLLASSPLSIVKVDVSKISNRLPDYPSLKITAMKPGNAQ